MGKVQWSKNSLYQLGGCRGCNKDHCQWNNGSITGDNSTKVPKYGCNSDKIKDEE